MSPEELKYFALELEKNATFGASALKYGRSALGGIRGFGTGLGRWARGKSWSPIKKPPVSPWAGRKEAIKGGLFTLGTAGVIGVGGTGYGLLTQPKSIINQRQF